MDTIEILLDTIENIQYAIDCTEQQYREQIESCTNAQMMEIIRHEFNGAKKIISVIRSIINQ